MINLKNILNEKLARGLKPLLVIGTTISKKTGEDTLVKLSDKFDRIDDEYAGDIASHLDMAIELMQDGYPGDATKMLKQFNKKCKDVLKGKPIASVFEGKLTEISKGDYIEDYGDVGLVNKVKGQVAYVKFNLNSTSFQPVPIADLKKRGKHKGKDLYVLFEGKLSENKLLKQDALSPAEYQKAKKLKGFDPKNYMWDKKQELHLIRKMSESVLRGQLAGDSALDMANHLRQYGVKKILKQPNDSVTYLQLTDKSKGNKVVAMLKKMFGIKAQIDNNMYSPTPAVKFDNDQIAESKLTEGFADKYKSKSGMSPLTQYLRAFMDWLWATQEDALDVAGNYEDQDEPKLAKDWIQFSTILIVSYKKLRNFKEKFAARTKAVLPTSLQKKLDNAKFHKGPTTEDNYKKVLKEVLMLVKEIEKIK